MKRFIEGEGRSQVTLLPECLDEFIASDNSVRVVDAFIDELDLLALGFDGGARCHRPAVLPPGCTAQDLHLWLPVPSPVEPEAGAGLPAQRLADVAHRSACAGLQDHCRLPAGSGKGIRNVCRQFVVLCRELKLFSQAVVAIDGSKFNAVNSRERNYTQGKLDRREREIETNIQRYLDALDTADRHAAEGIRFVCSSASSASPRCATEGWRRTRRRSSRCSRWAICGWHDGNCCSPRHEWARGTANAHDAASSRLAERPSRLQAMHRADESALHARSTAVAMRVLQSVPNGA